MHFPDYVSIPDIFPDWENKRDTEDLKDGRKTFPDLIEPDFTNVYENWRSTTLLSTDRAYNLFQVARYVAANKLPGDFVECGVLFGGASIMLAIFAECFGLKDRKHYLFDTFCGSLQPTVETDYADRKIPFGKWPTFRPVVERNIARCGIDASRFVIVEGSVHDTLPAKELTSLSVVRLDTDDYESTLHELRTLYPLLVPFGVLIIDDYGHYKGARRAVDEYFASIDDSPLLQRIDYSGRCAVKVPSPRSSA